MTSRVVKVRSVTSDTLAGSVPAAVGRIWLQVAVLHFMANLIAWITGSGTLNKLLYIYTVWLLGHAFLEAVEGAAYTMRDDKIILERKMGDITVNRVEIPFGSILSVRPAISAEKLSVSYRQVSYYGAGLKPSLRMRIAWLTALVSARVAGRIAGEAALNEKGILIAYLENDRPYACVATPDQETKALLAQAVGERWDWDDRLSRAEITSLQGYCLQRAFPALYPNVRPLISQEDEEWLAKWQTEFNEARLKKKTEREKKKQASHTENKE